ncbi:MAG: hypothetical protein A2252_12070 [Elusimicrobia bacterium RIFOXYA2_FULL_39_19]|nr:MAG: hypothetical protein A2252_12070 [Elusimicrobia bacterium RIFOXYA2_FULL_39_19]
MAKAYVRRSKNKNMNEKNKNTLLPKKFSNALDITSSKYEESFKIRALIQAIPWAGSSLDTMLSAEGIRIKKRRLESFLNKITDSLKVISEDKIDKKYLESEEFYELFLILTEKVMKSYEKNKIGLFKNIFINSLTNKGSDIYYKEGLINIVSNLSIKHIQILRYYFEREEIFKKEGRNPNNSFTSPHAIIQQCYIKESQFEGFTNDLVRFGLLYDTGLGRTDYKRFDYRITNYAQDFMNFITINNL